MLKKILAVFAASLFSVTAALAVDYSGKTVTMWIPFKAGGGSDTWARAIGPAFSANLPGNPTVVVKNVTDGKAIGASNKYFAEPYKNYVQLCNNVKKSLHRLWCWFRWG